jgi:hypothetical protein
VKEKRENRQAAERKRQEQQGERESAEKEEEQEARGGSRRQSVKPSQYVRAGVRQVTHDECLCPPTSFARYRSRDTLNDVAIRRP